MTNRVRLTKALIKGLKGNGKDQKIWDDNVRGLHVRVAPGGTKTFSFWYRNAEGEQRSQTIGRTESVELGVARKQARKLRIAVDAGEDPSYQRAENRSAPTMTELWNDYLELHAKPHKKPRSVKGDERLWRLHIEPYFARKKVYSIERKEIRKRHNEMRQTPGAANRMLALFSKMMSFAVEHGWCDSNPCLRIRKYPENQKIGGLSGEQITRLKSALDAFPDRCASTALYFMLLTGARKGETLSLRWDQLNLCNRNEATWTIPAGEQKGERDLRWDVKISLGSEIAQKMIDWRLSAPASEWVFPSDRKPTMHRKCMKTAWSKIRDHADLHGVRMHDLRHTFATVAVNNGIPLSAIGASLNHKDLRTTQKYARVSQDTVRSVADAVQNAMSVGA